MKEWTKEQIQKLRQRLNLYQREMAHRLGVTREYVVYLEKGVKTPSKTLKLLLDYIEREQNEKRKEKRKHGKGNL
ncbi:hypothetical protein NBG4_60044 [Candidatus Sulfobium mesophilum]|uniref:HTH cro/C1-type domain-containing protein n=1 Tax=Candidatus Sulfobium mesophilum TaxID=2016548 RepID=A0A2U3QJJ7_9BACT|nr:hypothetical protein NBG4_60044 [Candidatus Sulfobium mesophilum]